MIKNIKALAADIDMTLAAKGNMMAPINNEAFEELHKQGVLLGLATGREITDQQKHNGEFWHLSFEFDFIVGMNGGMVYDRHKDTLWSIDLMTTDEIHDIIYCLKPLIDKYQISVNAEGAENHNAMYIQGELLESAHRHGFMFVDMTGDYEGFCAKRAYKLLFRMKPEFEQEFRMYFKTNFRPGYQMVGTFPGTVEIMHDGIDKGSGLKRWADGAGIEMQDIIAFGDNENDNAMLKAAGWGVCLKDGSAGTKACADDITEYTCAEGGVGHYLFDHYLNK